MHTAQVEELYLQAQKKAYPAGKHNSQIKHIRALLNNTKPNPRKLCVIEGYWVIEKALQAELDIDALFFCPELITSIQAKEMVVKMETLTDRAYLLSEKVFHSISERNQPDGLLAVIRFNTSSLEHIPLRENNLVVVLDGLQIPGNIGTIIRAVDGFGGDAIILCNRRTRIMHPRIIKASQGMCFSVPIVEFTDGVDIVIEWLRRNAFTVYLADTRAKNAYYQYNYSGRTALIVGSERYGMFKQWYDSPHRKIHIPQFGKADSLNVAMATTVLLCEMSLCQRHFLTRVQPDKDSPSDH